MQRLVQREEWKIYERKMLSNNALKSACGKFNFFWNGNSFTKIFKKMSVSYSNTVIEIIIKYFIAQYLSISVKRNCKWLLIFFFVSLKFENSKCYKCQWNTFGVTVTVIAI